MQMKPHRYLILVEGDLRATDQEALADLEIRRLPANRTALSGSLDQSGLYGILSRLQYLALEVFEVHRLCGCLDCRSCRRAPARV
jgi:hypothetical protein